MAPVLIGAPVLFGLEWGRRTYLAAGRSGLSIRDPSAWVDLIAIVIAVVVTYFAGLSIRAQKKSQQEEMRDLAREAVNKALGSSVRQAPREDFLETCAKLSGKKVNEVRARANFYARADQERLKYYGLQGAQELVACRLIALLTDLPPRWIFDCYTNRRGAIPETTDAESK
jgi:hypothetical protein